MGKVLNSFGDKNYLLAKGEEFYDSGQYKKALRHFFQAKKLDRLCNEADWGIALCYRDMKLIGLSNAVFFSVLARGEDRNAVFEELGKNFYLSDDTLHEIYYFGNIGKLEMDSSMIAFLRGMAADKFEQIKPVSKVKVKTLLEEAWMFVETGYYDNAKLSIEKVLRGTPSNQEAMLLLAFILASEKNFSDALQVANMVICEENEALRRAVMFVCSYETKLLDEALQHRHQLKHYLAEVDKRQHSLACRLLTEHKHYEDALALTEKTLKQNKYDIMLFGYACMLAFNCKQFDKAKGFLVAINELYPDSIVVHYYLRHVKAVQNGEADFEEMKTIWKLPSQERDRLQHSLREMDFANTADPSKLDGILRWILVLKDKESVQEMLQKLAKENPPIAKDFMKNLVMQDTLVTSKTLACKMLFEQFGESAVWCNRENYVDLVSPPRKMPKVVDKSLYMFCYCMCSMVVVEEFEKKLFEAAEEVQHYADKNSEALKPHNLTESMLQFFIIRRTELEQFDDKTLCNMLGINYNDVQRVSEVLFCDE